MPLSFLQHLKKGTDAAQVSVQLSASHALQAGGAGYRGGRQSKAQWEAKAQRAHRTSPGCRSTPAEEPHVLGHSTIQGLVTWWDSPQTNPGNLELHVPLSGFTEASQPPSPPGRAFNTDHQPSSSQLHIPLVGTAWKNTTEVLIWDAQPMALPHGSHCTCWCHQMGCVGVAPIPNHTTILSRVQ